MVIISLVTLQLFALLNYCPLHTMQETKSVGAEINWGVRFNDNKDVGPLCFYVLYYCSTTPFRV